MTALNKQIAGNHYKDLKIQPIEYIHANGIGYLEGNAIKYLTRWRAKGGLADLEKAKHYIELLIELEFPKQAVPADDDDWIEWNGGRCPVDPKLRVAIKFREGYQASFVADMYRWDHDGSGSDIVAYRVVR